MNTSRFTSYHSLRGEILTFLEVKTGLKVKDPKIQKKDQDAMDVDSLGKGSSKGEKDPRARCVTTAENLDTMQLNAKREAKVQVERQEVQVARKEVKALERDPTVHRSSIERATTARR